MPWQFQPFNPDRPKRIIKRYDGNPILTGDDFPGDITWVFNCGVVKDNGKYIMLCRVEDSSLFRFLWVADSDDGFHFKPRPMPVELPEDDPEWREYCRNTYYDPRVTKIDDTFYIVFAAHSSHTCRLGLFTTRDFDKFEWRGCMSLPDNRNGILFPEKINGRYARLDRPNCGWGDKGDIWISYSPDLVYWGDSKCVIRTSDFAWAYHKIGGGAVPIKTDEGWLIIFHGVRTQCAQHYVYQLGVFMTDLENPGKVIAKAERAILVPEKDYELAGQTPSVVFTNAAIPEDDGTVKIYYGGADSVQCVGIATMKDLLDACRNI
jgi:predicted GH43/DUF377 family glycosyl hydrolase